MSPEYKLDNIHKVEINTLLLLLSLLLLLFINFL